MARVARFADMAVNNNDNNNDEDARQFLPPPGIHPNNAVFGGVQLPKPLTWQRREHMIQRRSILGRIGQLLTRNAQLVASSDAAAAATNSPTVDPHAKTWALARKLEVLIFLNSASLMEYSNVDSLARRVQALTASIVNKKIRRQHIASPTVTNNNAIDCSGSNPVPPATAQAFVHRRPRTVATNSSNAVALAACRPLPLPPAAAALVPPLTIPPPAAAALHSNASSPLPGISFLMHTKRSAADVLSLPVPPTKRMRLPLPPNQRPSDRLLGHFLFRGYDELTRIVWSFVDGTQILRCRAVDRTAQALAPLFVTSLQLSCNAAQRALATPYRPTSSSSLTNDDAVAIRIGACVLRACVHLQHLEIVALSAGMAFGQLSMRALDCPQRFVVTHDDHEQIVVALAHQLHSATFPRLRRLGITCLFTNEEADGEADVLLNTLMTGCCPQLEELCLPGNSFGDYGASKVTQMLRARVCPRLTRLDLRRNFVGEDGVRSICHALADGCAPALTELCFGGNTLTDSSFHHILYALESRRLPLLRFLGLEMNYLSIASMEMLGRSIGKLVCPQLAQISYSDNSVDNSVAKRAIATAVYDERIRRTRRQQLMLQHQQRSGIGERVYDSHSDHSDEEEEDEDEDEEQDDEGEVVGL